MQLGGKRNIQKARPEYLIYWTRFELGVPVRRLERVTIFLVD
jgi:hypothetical protein